MYKYYTILAFGFVDTLNVCTCWSCCSQSTFERSWWTHSAPSSSMTSSFFTGSTINAVEYVLSRNRPTVSPQANYPSILHRHKNSLCNSYHHRSRDFRNSVSRRTVSAWNNRVQDWLRRCKQSCSVWEVWTVSQFMFCRWWNRSGSLRL